MKKDKTVLPNYLQNIPFIKITSLHEHDTRSKHNIHQMKPYHEYAKNCLRYNIPVVLNNNLPEIRNKMYTHHLQGFV